MKTLTRIIALALCLFPVALLAQVAAPVIPPGGVTFNLPSTATATLLSYVPDLLTVLAALVAWWKHTQLKGARKIIGGIAEGVEAFTTTSVGTDLKQKLESTITARVNQADPSGGLGKILNDVVDEVTPHVRAEMAALGADQKPDAAAPAPAALPSNPPAA